MKQALGLVEIQGLSTAVVVADTMAKAANIRILEVENTKGLGYMTIKVAGDVGAVNAAVNAGRQVGIENRKLVSWKVIPRPSDYVEHTFCSPNPPSPPPPAPKKGKAGIEETAEPERLNHTKEAADRTELSEKSGAELPAEAASFDTEKNGAGEATGKAEAEQPAGVTGAGEATGKEQAEQPDQAAGKAEPKQSRKASEAAQSAPETEPKHAAETSGAGDMALEADPKPSVQEEKAIETEPPTESEQRDQAVPEPALQAAPPGEAHPDENAEPEQPEPSEPAPEKKRQPARSTGTAKKTSAVKRKK